MRKIILPNDVETALEKIVSEYSRNMFLLVFSIKHHMDDTIINKYFIESERLAIKKEIGVSLIKRDFAVPMNSPVQIDFSTNYLEISE